MVEANSQPGMAVYEEKSFFDDCERFFAAKMEFVVVCDEKSALRCRKAVDAFLSYERAKARGWQRFRLLANGFFVGMRAPLAVAICNKALLLQWDVSTGGMKANQVLRLSPPSVAQRKV